MESENRPEKKSVSIDFFKSIISSSLVKLILLFYLTFQIVSFSGNLAFVGISTMTDFINNFRIGSMNMLILYISLILICAILSIFSICMFFMTLVNFVLPKTNTIKSENQDEVVKKSQRNLRRRFTIIITYALLSILCSEILQISVHLYR